MMTVEQFVEKIRKSDLVHEEQLSSLLDELRAGLSRDSGGSLLTQLTDQLVKREMLTSWQCAKIAEDRDQQFFFEGKYKVLDRLPGGRHYFRYLAENIVTRQNVDLIFMRFENYWTVAVIQPGQLINALRVDLSIYYRHFLSKYKIVRRWRRGGRHNSRQCLAEDRTSHALVAVILIPTGELTSVIITQPRQVIEIGLSKKPTVAGE